MPSLPSHLPATAGIGFKTLHFDAMRTDPGPVRWIEVHAENYLDQGGRGLAQLEALRRDFAVSLHGVGLSLGGAAPPDRAHLARLRALIDRIEPASFSEHLAWSRHDGAFFNDLLPLPLTGALLARVVEHVEIVQEALGRTILLENPSSYLVFTASEMGEPAFLDEVARRSGCGLLLDVNNVHVSAANLGFSATDYLDAFPMPAVGEIHVAGHDEEEEEDGRTLLIDTHASAVAEPVWDLLSRVLARTGPLPVLIERDSNLPDWPVLRAEAGIAARLIAAAARGVAA